MPEMSDDLAFGAECLADWHRLYASSWVHYLRSTSSVRIRAMKGRDSFDVTDGNGQLTRVDTVDFLIHVTDLELDGLAIVPQAGDRIVTGNLADGQAHEVASIAGQDVWRWADEFKNRFRIHTKDVGAHP